MIAFPIKTEKKESALAPLFGKAKWFAFADEKGEITVSANKAEGGIKTAQWFEKSGIKTLITCHLGEKPFHALQKAGIQIYFAGKERIDAKEALQKFKEGALEEVNVTNYMRLLGEEQAEKKGHGCGDSEEMGAFRTKVKCCEKPKNYLLNAHHGEEEGCHGGHEHGHEHGACCHHDH